MRASELENTYVCLCVLDMETVNVFVYNIPKRMEIVK